MEKSLSLKMVRRQTLDLGHYERFLDRNLTKNANVTTGKVYSSVIAKRRSGEYLGKDRAGDSAYYG